MIRISILDFRFSISRSRVRASALLACALLFGFGSADAQQPPKIPRIGYVSGTGSANDQGPYVEALRQGLRELRHVEGRTFILEYRGAEGKLDRLPSIMKELTQLKVDVLVAPFSGAVRAAKQATTTIPIVFVTGADPVANGWVASLARPGGNITGVLYLGAGFKRKTAGANDGARAASIIVLRYCGRPNEQCQRG